MKWRLLAIGAGVLVALSVVLLVARSDSSSKSPKRVAIFGDSLTTLARPYLDQFFAHDRGYDVQVSSLPGTAICDLLAPMRSSAASFRPQVVEIQFVGNDIYPCMRKPDGSKLSKAAYLARWQRDTKRAIAVFGPHTTIYLVGPPAMQVPDNRVYTIFRRAAQQSPNVHFVDGDALLSPGRRFVKTQPCLPNESCTGPVQHGVHTNVVRAWDGTHFCPKKVAFGAPCPGYSSGAYRFAIDEYRAITGTAPAGSGL
jgi:hypothetical protein